MSRPLLPLRPPAAPSALRGKDLRVLVLCAGAGTSALLANALKEGADELGIDITANAGAYGSHYAIMDQYNVIVLAPRFAPITTR